MVFRCGGAEAAVAVLAAAAVVLTPRFRHCVASPRLGDPPVPQSATLADYFDRLLRMDFPPWKGGMSGRFGAICAKCGRSVEEVVVVVVVMMAGNRRWSTY